MINLNKLDKKLTTKNFNVWVYPNKHKNDLKNYYIVLNIIKIDNEGIYMYVEKETKITKQAKYKQIVKFVNDFKKEFKTNLLNENKEWFDLYTWIK